MSESDDLWMRRAIRLAMNGRGFVEPNPMVGCVIVKDDRVIGEGFHEKFGGPHAELNALASCTESPEGATAYVTLEPCCHTVKKTPPCVPKLIEAKVGRTVVGCLDPNPEVNTEGVNQLRGAGIAVNRSMLDPQCRQLIAPFLAGVAHHRPYVTLKSAQSADGRVSGPNGQPVRLSNDRSWRLVHLLRSRSDAILIGGGTLWSDNPRLTPRDVPPNRRPLRVVVTGRLRYRPNIRLLHPDGQGPVLFVCSTSRALSKEADAIRCSGAEVAGLGTSDDLDIRDVLSLLFKRGVTHLTVEPGPNLAQRFFDANAADRVWLFKTQQVIHDATARIAAPIPESYLLTGEHRLDDNLLLEYLNPASDVFAARAPSADFILASESTN